MSDSCPDWNSRASRKSQMHCASGDSTILYPWAAALPTSALSSVGKKDKGSMTEGSLTFSYSECRVPSKSVDKTPHEMWTRKSPGLSFLKIWGCEAFVKRLMSDKLTPKSDKCISWDIRGNP